MQVPAALAAVLSAACILLTTAPTAGADSVTPKSAPAFRDSVGVVTHAVYYDTAYGNWPKVVASLRKLGVNHLRDGLYANESPEWRDWTTATTAPSTWPPPTACASTSGWAAPDPRSAASTSSWPWPPAACATPRRPSRPPTSSTSTWAGAAGRRGSPPTTRPSTARSSRRPSLRSLPFVGPSFSTVEAARTAGNQRSWMDLGNVHPYTGGRSPTPRTSRPSWARRAPCRAASRCGPRRPASTTRMNARSGQPGVSERVAAVYLLRTFLEHFRSGISRTYAYELLDEKPERAGRDPEQHFGLMRNDFTPKPAFTALRNLLEGGGAGRRHAPACARCASASSGRAHPRKLVLRRADGTYLVALWRRPAPGTPTAGARSAWRRETATVTLPRGARVRLVDPVASRGGRPAATPSRPPFACASATGPCSSRSRDARGARPPARRASGSALAHLGWTGAGPGAAGQRAAGRPGGRARQSGGGPAPRAGRPRPGMRWPPRRPSNARFRPPGAGPTDRDLGHPRARALGSGDQLERQEISVARRAGSGSREASASAR